VITNQTNTHKYSTIILILLSYLFLAGCDNKATTDSSQMTSGASNTSNNTVAASEAEETKVVTDSVAATHNYTEQKELVGHFIQVLHANPTLNDFQEYYGYVDREEMEFQWQQCAERGLDAPVKNRGCYDTIVMAWRDKLNTPSLYLAWLATYLPYDAEMTINSVVSGTGELAGENISVSFSTSRHVDFWRPLTQGDTEAKQKGILIVSGINGVPVQRLAQQDNMSSVLVGLGLTPYLRPYTDKEKASIKVKATQRCDNNPSCVAQRSAHAEREKVMEKSTEVIARTSQSYLLWCKQNATECQKARKNKKAIIAQREDIERLCLGDKNNCDKHVKAWFAKRHAAQGLFCQENKQDCLELTKVELLRAKHQLKLCIETPKCEQELSNFELTYMRIKADSNYMNDL